MTDDEINALVTRLDRLSIYAVSGFTEAADTIRSLRAQLAAAHPFSPEEMAFIAEAVDYLRQNQNLNDDENAMAYDIGPTDMTDEIDAMSIAEVIARTSHEHIICMCEEFNRLWDDLHDVKRSDLLVLGEAVRRALTEGEVFKEMVERAVYEHIKYTPPDDEDANSFERDTRHFLRNAILAALGDQP